MTKLSYRSRVAVEELAENECTIHRASKLGDDATFWWNLWFHVRRETDNQLEMFVVPIAPRGSYTENGPGGRTWGFTLTAPGIWQVAPSINVLNDNDVRLVQAGAHPTGTSLWHQTPAVMGVPVAGEAWM